MMDGRKRISECESCSHISSCQIGSRSCSPHAGRVAALIWHSELIDYMKAYLNETLAGATSLLAIWHILRSAEFLHWTVNLCHIPSGWYGSSRAREHECVTTRGGLGIKVADHFRRPWSFRFFYLYLQFCAVFNLTKYAMLQTSRAMNKAGVIKTVAMEWDCTFFCFLKGAFCHITSHLFFVLGFSILPKSLPASRLLCTLTGDFCWYVSFAGSPSLNDQHDVALTN